MLLAEGIIAKDINLLVEIFLKKLLGLTKIANLSHTL
jgi:hypothetical protein